MNALIHWLSWLVHRAFWTCCDLMVNLANRTHTSYYEANTWVLLVLLPLLLALLIGVRVTQWFRLRKLRT